MVNTFLLEEFISKSGKTKSHIAKKAGMTIQTLKKKSTNHGDFMLREVEAICEELEIKNLTDKNRIFFAKNVDNQPTDKELCQEDI